MATAQSILALRKQLIAATGESQKTEVSLLATQCGRDGQIRALGGVRGFLSALVTGFEDLKGVRSPRRAV